MHKVNDIIVTKHARERYASRFKGIRRNLVNFYTEQHRDIIDRDLKKMYMYSDYYVDNHRRKNSKIFVNNDISIVTSGSKIVTVFRRKRK